MRGQSSNRVMLAVTCWLFLNNLSSASPPVATRPEVLLAAALVEPENEFAQQLRAQIRFSGIDDPKTTFEETLDQLAVRYRLKFHLNERALGKQQSQKLRKYLIADPKPLPRMTEKIRTVLQAIVDRLPESDGVAIMVRDKHVEITTKAALRHELFSGLR